jgi:hypothetical protein
MYRPRDFGEVISARYVLADKAAVEHPNPVRKRPPRSMLNDLVFAEMIAPILNGQNV